MLVSKTPRLEWDRPGLLFARRPIARSGSRPDFSDKRVTVALSLFFCVCLCAGVAFSTSALPLFGKIVFTGRAMAAEAGNSGPEKFLAAGARTTEAKEGQSGSSARQEPRKASAADILDSKELTRALSRLLNPEQAPSRVPDRSSVPGPASDSPQGKKAEEFFGPAKKQDAAPAPAEKQATPTGRAAAKASPVPAPAKPVVAVPTAPSVPSPAAPVMAAPTAQAQAKASPDAGTPKKEPAPSGGKAVAPAPTKPSQETRPAAQTSKGPVPAEAEKAEVGGGRSANKSSPDESGEKAKHPETKRADDKSGEATEVVSRQNVVRAEIKPVNLMVLSAPCDGVVASILASDGDKVDKGQTVARLDTRAAEQSLAVAQTLAADAFERLGALPEGPSRERDALAGEYLRYSAEVRAHETVLAQGVINAPFAGTVTEVHAKTGEHVKQGSPLVEVAESGSLEVVCAVPSTWLRWLKPGHIVWVYVDETAKSYEAVLVRLGGKVDSASKTLRVYARFSNPPADLLPGMSGSASIRPQFAEGKTGTRGVPERNGSIHQGNTPAR